MIKDKIIHTIVKNHKLNKSIKIILNKLGLNLLNVKDVNQAIKILLKSKIKSGNYIIKSRKFTNIVKLVKEINKKINNKIKFKVLNNKIEKNRKKLIFYLIGNKILQ